MQRPRPNSNLNQGTGSDSHGVLTRSACRRCRTDAAKAALDRLEAAIERKCTSVKLVPGDVLLLDNRRTVHSRSSFSPAYDGKDRWLQRVWGRPETWGGRTAAMTHPLVYV